MKVALFAVVLLVAVIQPVMGADASFEQIAFEKMLAATQTKSQEEFVAFGDEAFKAMPKEAFLKATEKFAPMLKAGYKFSYLGSFKQKDIHVHYWKLSFTSDPNEWLAKMGIANEKVKGFFITSP